MQEKRVISKWGGLGVDIKLWNMYSNSQVCWSHGNSFVIVEGKALEPGQNPDVYDPQEGPWITQSGRKVHLVSINGMGQVRWHVEYDGSYQREDEKNAIKYFGLRPTDKILKRHGEVGGDE